VELFDWQVILVVFCFLSPSFWGVLFSLQIGEKMREKEGLDENLLICPSPPSTLISFF